MPRRFVIIIIWFMEDINAQIHALILYDIMDDNMDYN